MLCQTTKAKEKILLVFNLIRMSEHFPKEVTKENIQELIELAKKIDAKANQTSYGLLSIFLLTCSNCSVGHRLLILDKLDCSEVLEDFGIKVVALPAGLDWKMLGGKTRFSVYNIICGFPCFDKS